MLGMGRTSVGNQPAGRPLQKFLEEHDFGKLRQLGANPLQRRWTAVAAEARNLHSLLDRGNGLRAPAGTPETDGVVC